MKNRQKEKSNMKRILVMILALLFVGSACAPGGVAAG